MTTINKEYGFYNALERKLHAARRGVPGAKYQTGLVIMQKWFGIVFVE